MGSDSVTEIAISFSIIVWNLSLMPIDEKEKQKEYIAITMGVKLMNKLNLKVKKLKNKITPGKVAIYLIKKSRLS